VSARKRVEVAVVTGGAYGIVSAPRNNVSPMGHPTLAIFDRNAPIAANRCCWPSAVGTVAISCCDRADGFAEGARPRLAGRSRFWSQCRDSESFQRRATDITAGRWDQSIEVIFTARSPACQAHFRTCSAEAGDRIVTISSSSAQCGGPEHGALAASKGGRHLHSPKGPSRWQIRHAKESRNTIAPKP